MNKTRYILTGIFIIVLLLIPQLGLNNYLFHLIAYSLIWVILTQGLNVIQGYTGYISIAQASFFGIGAYSSALLSTKLDMSVWLSIPVAVVITTLAGLIIGYPALKTKGHYFAIVTMSFGMSIWVVMVSWVKLTNGETGMPAPAPENLFGIDFSQRENYFYLIAIGVLISIFIVYRLVNSKSGRALITIKENEQLAQAVGISLIRYKMLAFTVSAMLGGLAGALFAHYIHFINPTSFSIDYSLNTILAVILGGSGTIVGPIIGSFIMILLPEYLRAIEELRLVIYGIAIILFVIFMPRGIAHLLKNVSNSLIKKITNKK